MYIIYYIFLPDHLGALNISDNFLSVGTSGMENHEILLGRPYGGHIRREQLGDALSQSRYNDFWRVVRNAAKSSKGASILLHLVLIIILASLTLLMPLVTSFTVS